MSAKKIFRALMILSASFGYAEDAAKEFRAACEHQQWDIAARYASAIDKPDADAESVFLLGRMHEKGTGVQRDIVKARDYYERAEKAGSIKACVNLGYLYLVELDDAAKGAGYLQRALDKDDEKAAGIITRHLKPYSEGLRILSKQELDIVQKKLDSALAEMAEVKNDRKAISGELESVKKKLAESQAELSDAQKKMSARKSEQETSQQTIARNEEKISELNQKNKELEHHCKELEARCEKLDERCKALVALTHEWKKTYENLKARIDQGASVPKSKHSSEMTPPLGSMRGIATLVCSPFNLARAFKLTQSCAQKYEEEGVVVFIFPFALISELLPVAEDVAVGFLDTVSLGIIGNKIYQTGNCTPWVWERSNDSFPPSIAK